MTLRNKSHEKETHKRRTATLAVMNYSTASGQGINPKVIKSKLQILNT
jgi:hypothetical protein